MLGPRRPSLGRSRMSSPSIRRWGLWSIPMSARLFLLAVECAAVVLTVGMLSTEPVSWAIVSRFGVLAALTISYGELAIRSERIKRYLGSDQVYANPLSVWSFAAVLTMPAGWASALISLQYAHVLLQRRRDKSGRPFRVVFRAAAAMVAQLSTAAAFDPGDAGGVLHGQALASLAVLAGVALFTFVNLSVLLVGVWLSVRPPTLRAMLPDTDALGYELATLLLGIAAAELLLHTAALTPFMLVIVAYVHRSSATKALRHAARTDVKTGLLNIAAWTEYANAMLSRSARHGRSVAVMVIDIDRFKRINDIHGHLVGDEVLIAVAACLRRDLRGHDGLGRFGGDEFVVILDEVDLAMAEVIGNRLRTSLSALHVGDDVSLSVSIGLAHEGAEAQSSDVQRLLKRADTALYYAKSSGRGRVCTAADRGSA
jgi:diguanylate cyclase (GGDEF)-like protein